MKLISVAGAAALCGALLITGCAKKTTDQSTTTTDAQSATDATSAPDSGATPAPATDASTAPGTSTVTAGGTTISSGSSSGNGTSAGFIDIPVYSGAAIKPDEGISASGNGTSVATKIYSTKDDAKHVADWYKSHLPSNWQNSIITSGGKTMATFVDEHKSGDGDQSVLVTNGDDGTTRIQLTTKRGK